MRLQTWPFLLVAFGHASYAMGQTLQFFEQGGTISPPPLLFHWMSQGSAQSLAAPLSNSNEPLPLKLLPLKIVDPSARIAMAHPDLSGRAGLFAWTHPVLGMGTQPTENYGADPWYPDRSPILLVMRPKPDARVRVIDSEIYERIVDGEKKWITEVDLGTVENADLVYHRMRIHRLDSRTNDADPLGEPFLQEWIVLEPSAIESFTADKETGMEILGNWDAKLGTLEIRSVDAIPTVFPAAAWSPKEMHWHEWSNVFLNDVRRALEAYRKLPATQIPVTLQRKTSFKCPGLMLTE